MTACHCLNERHLTFRIAWCREPDGAAGTCVTGVPNSYAVPAKRTRSSLWACLAPEDAARDMPGLYMRTEWPVALAIAAQKQTAVRRQGGGNGMCPLPLAPDTRTDTNTFTLGGPPRSQHAAWALCRVEQSERPLNREPSALNREPVSQIFSSACRAR